MNGHDIVVMGASAGGVRTLRTIFAAFPPTLPAAILVTLHITPDAPSVLPDLLGRASRLPAGHAVDGEPVEKGRIYVAPPDHHLLVRGGAIGLSRGPRESGARPAADPMFRSAAREYGPRVIGVVLSGGLDDGTAGLRAIKARGGISVVQAPESALVAEMPRNAIAEGVADYIVHLDELPARLLELIKAPAPMVTVSRPSDDAELVAARVDRGVLYQTQPGVPSDFTCPDCGGVLRLIPDKHASHYRCQVGHAWNQRSLLAAQVERIEESLWAAVRALEEHAKLTRRVRDDLKRRNARTVVDRLDERLSESEHHAREIRKLLLKRFDEPATVEEDDDVTQQTAT